MVLPLSCFMCEIQNTPHKKVRQVRQPKTLKIKEVQYSRIILIENHNTDHVKLIQVNMFYTYT